MFWIGIGCQKGISLQLVNVGILQIFQQYQLANSNISGLATIDIKASEFAIKEYCQINNLPLKTFSAETLAGVCVPHPNQKLTEKVGTASVAEASAILAALAITSDMNLLKLLVPKQVFRLPGETKAVTIAVVEILAFSS
ncbi:MAG: cobalamin biosynthesis protein CbiG [Nostocales cyanobacterium]|nr:MAG: cobalamin biosynthesis protein CbiG [Nostocales cyanobacterium]TAF12372.1 MAG: cobalamin biosynthesis protein CbiG [Nostocales cyanobacterium]